VAVIVFKPAEEKVTAQAPLPEEEVERIIVQLETMFVAVITTLPVGDTEPPVTVTLTVTA